MIAKIIAVIAHEIMEEYRRLDSKPRLETSIHEQQVEDVTPHLPPESFPFGFAPVRSGQAS